MMSKLPDGYGVLPSREQFLASSPCTLPEGYGSLPSREEFLQATTLDPSSEVPSSSSQNHLPHPGFVSASSKMEGNSEEDGIATRRVLISSAPALFRTTSEDDFLQPISCIEFEMDKGKKVVLGKGAFGKVCKAEFFSEPVAVKEMQVETRSRQEALLQEARLLKSLRHSCIVEMRCVCIDKESLKTYMVLKYCPGSTLEDYGRKNHPLSDLTIALLARDVAAGLAYLESKHVTHRDLKPDNILLDNAVPQGEVGWAKICDFGLSKRRKLLDSSRSAAASHGAYKWMAEEVVNADIQRVLQTPVVLDRYESSADVYSFGLVLLFLFLGTHPISNEDFDNCLIRLLRTENEPFPKPKVPETVPATFKKLIEECLDSDPKKRPTCKDLMKFFMRFLSQYPLGASGSGSSPLPSTPTSSPSSSGGSILARLHPIGREFWESHAGVSSLYIDLDRMAEAIANCGGLKAPEIATITRFLEARVEKTTKGKISNRAYTQATKDGVDLLTQYYAFRDFLQNWERTIFKLSKKSETEQGNVLASALDSNFSLEFPDITLKVLDYFVTTYERQRNFFSKDSSTVWGLQTNSLGITLAEYAKMLAMGKGDGTLVVVTEKSANFDLLLKCARMAAMICGSKFSYLELAKPLMDLIIIVLRKRLRVARLNIAAFLIVEKLHTEREVSSALSDQYQNIVSFFVDSIRFHRDNSEVLEHALSGISKILSIEAGRRIITPLLKRTDIVGALRVLKDHEDDRVQGSALVMLQRLTSEPTTLEVPSRVSASLSVNRPVSPVRRRGAGVGGEKSDLSNLSTTDIFRLSTLIGNDWKNIVNGFAEVFPQGYISWMDAQSLPAHQKASHALTDIKNLAGPKKVTLTLKDIKALFPGNSQVQEFTPGGGDRSGGGSLSPRSRQAHISASISLSSSSSGGESTKGHTSSPFVEPPTQCRQIWYAMKDLEVRLEPNLDSPVITRLAKHSAIIEEQRSGSGGHVFIRYAFGWTPLDPLSTMPWEMSKRMEKNFMMVPESKKGLPWMSLWSLPIREVPGRNARTIGELEAKRKVVELGRVECEATVWLKVQATSSVAGWCTMIDKGQLAFVPPTYRVTK